MQELSEETKRLFRLLPQQELFASGSTLYENGRATIFKAHYVAERRFLRLDVNVYEANDKHGIRMEEGTHVVDFIEIGGMGQKDLTLLCSDMVHEIEQDQERKRSVARIITPVTLRLVKK